MSLYPFSSSLRYKIYEHKTTQPENKKYSGENIPKKQVLTVQKDL